LRPAVTSPQTTRSGGRRPHTILRWAELVPVLRSGCTKTCNRPSPGKIGSVVTALGDIAAVLAHANPADKAEIYSQLGLRLTDQPGQRIVLAAAHLDQAPAGAAACSAAAGSAGAGGDRLCRVGEPGSLLLGPGLRRVPGRAGACRTSASAAAQPRYAGGPDETGALSRAQPEFTCQRAFDPHAA
jgi:hypothetical protein